MIFSVKGPEFGRIFMFPLVDGLFKSFNLLRSSEQGEVLVSSTITSKKTRSQCCCHWFPSFEHAFLYAPFLLLPFGPSSMLVRCHSRVLVVLPRRPAGSYFSGIEFGHFAWDYFSGMELKLGCSYFSAIWFWQLPWNYFSGIWLRHFATAYFSGILAWGYFSDPWLRSDACNYFSGI